MNQIRILLNDGRSLILPEDEILCEISDVLLSFTNPTDYLEIEKGYGRTLVLNKAYIVGINIEEADEQWD